MLVAGDTFYFFPVAGGGDDELWKSDGTEAGTIVVKDINPSGSSFNEDIEPGPMVAGSCVIWFADDGTHGFEPWITDGTEAGTMLIKDINPEGSSRDDNI